MEEDKTIFTIKHAQIFYETLADILGKKYNVDIKVTVIKKDSKEETLKCRLKK